MTDAAGAAADKKATIDRLLQTVGGLLLAILAWTVGRTVSQLDDVMESARTNSTRITAIESSRFTAANALEVWQAIAALKTEMATIASPAAWLKESVAEQKQSISEAKRLLEELSKRMSGVERAVERIEARRPN